MEYTYRDGKALRRAGVLALNDAYTRLFLAIRIWEKNADGYFGRAAVWGKNDDDIISVRKAVDFGSRELNVLARKDFEVKE